MGRGEDLGFNSKGGGSPGALWTKAGQDLTHMLTGTLQLPQGECSGPGETNPSYLSLTVCPQANEFPLCVKFLYLFKGDSNNAILEGPRQEL